MLSTWCYWWWILLPLWILLWWDLTMLILFLFWRIPVVLLSKYCWEHKSHTNRTKNNKNFPSHNSQKYFWTKIELRWCSTFVYNLIITIPFNLLACLRVFTFWPSVKLIIEILVLLLPIPLFEFNFLFWWLLRSKILHKSLKKIVFHSIINFN